jgi:hypothetical protein
MPFLTFSGSFLRFLKPKPVGLLNIFLKTGKVFGVVLQGANSEQISQIFPVLRIRDVYPGSRILIFTHPGSRISDPGSRISDPGSKNSNKRER